ncbi:hypothetical protein Nepgr_015079 [Nepenthes gracilis]|uniref:Uncharacterized protein n=1 Tax=Nepenthes gracilis TaxID=150966 RepID=A0AAD3SL59_NEPGR|nr:hypothetical protein Nepgr_015079 [Nepenthes gracilis]
MDNKIITEIDRPLCIRSCGNCKQNILEFLSAIIPLLWELNGFLLNFKDWSERVPAGGQSSWVISRSNGGVCFVNHHRGEKRGSLASLQLEFT